MASTWVDLGDFFSEDWREIPDGNLKILKVLREKKNGTKKPENEMGLQRKILIQSVLFFQKFFVEQQT